MIACLRGTLVDWTGDLVVVLPNSGVGYEIRFQERGAEPELQLGDVVTFWIMQVNTDTEQKLFGFVSPSARQLALDIWEAGIKPIGPTVAHRIVNDLSEAVVRTALVNGDAAKLAQVKGVSSLKAKELVQALQKSVKSSTRLGELFELYRALGGEPDGEGALATLAGQHPEYPIDAVVKLALTRVQRPKAG